MPRQRNRRASQMRRLIDPVMTFTIRFSGGVVLFLVLALLVYLLKEGSSAFDQKFPYGFRFALQPSQKASDYDFELDPTVSSLKAHPDGADGVDDQEDGILMPTIEELAGFSPTATGTALTGDIAAIKPDELYRDDWRTPHAAEKGDTMLLFAFATPEAEGDTMTLQWAPDAAFEVGNSPYDFRLKLVSAPVGISVPPIDIDLKKQPNGTISVPVWRAETDEDRTKGYVFRLEARPTTSTFLATLSSFFRTDWAPTLQYPRFGFVPLFLSTIGITLLATLLAAPISIWVAVFLSEVASPRMREWLKPTVELLASVPTVVLGYLGLILVAPRMQQVFASALSMESGVNMLTASVVLAILLIPTITTITEDALANAPGTLREGGEALGLTQRESLASVILPAVRSGMIGAVLLGLARAFGETMIIWMLSGGTPRMPAASSPKAVIDNLGQSTRGMADTVAIEMGNVDFGGVHYGHLFLLGAILFIFSLAINLFGYRMARRSAWTQ